MILNKYPDLSSIKKHPAHKNILYSKRLNTLISNKILKKNRVTLNFSTDPCPKDEIINFVEPKAITPLPPLSQSCEYFLFSYKSKSNVKSEWESLIYDKIFNQYNDKVIFIQIADLKKLVSKKTKESIDYSQKIADSKDRYSKVVSEPNRKYAEDKKFDKAKGKLKPIARNKNLKENLLNKWTSKKHIFLDNEEKPYSKAKKYFKESIVQTNDLDYEFHLIIDETDSEALIIEKIPSNKHSKGRSLDGKLS